MSLTLIKIFDDVTKLLGIETPNFSPVYIRERVVADVNAALQTMAASDKDYFQRESATLNLVDGTAGYDLAEDLLHVVFPMRFADGTLLREITTRGNFELFGQVFLGETAAQGSRAKPMGVFIEGQKRSGSETNLTKARAFFAPTPDASYTVTLDITKRPTIYTVADLSDDTLKVPVPQNFCESILLPLVRWNVRTSNYFNRHEMLPDLGEQAAAAMRMLGMADPRVNQSERSDSNRLEAAKQAARSAAREAYNRTLQGQ